MHRKAVFVQLLRFATRFENLMNPHEQRETAFPPGEDWQPAPPTATTAPSFWPAGLALGSTLVVWGLIGSVILLGVGGAMFFVSLAGWIGEIRHERKRHESRAPGARTHS